MDHITDHADEQPSLTTAELDERADAVTDRCPSWAAEIIHKIMLLEVESGTIKNPVEQNSSQKWSTAQLDDLARLANRLDQDQYSNITAEVEVLFVKLSRGLAGHGFSAVEITTMINSRIPTGCRLPYCNADEVLAAID
jgi:hypothetical protein